MGIKVKVKGARVGSLDVFAAREFEKGDGKPRYNFTAIVTPGTEADKAIEAAIEAVAKDAWGAKAPEKLVEFRGNPKRCYAPGSIKNYEGYEGNKILSAHRAVSQGAPRILAADGKSLLRAEDGLPYRGSYVVLYAELYALTTGKFQGIYASFSDVQFMKHGDAFGGGFVAPDQIEDLSDGAAADADFGL